MSATSNRLFDWCFLPRWKLQLTAERHALAGISGTDGIPKGVTTSATSPRVPFVLVSCLEPCICQLLHYPLLQAYQIPHLDALSPLLAPFVQSSLCPTTPPIPHSPEFSLGASPVWDWCRCIICHPSLPLSPTILLQVLNLNYSLLHSHRAALHLAPFMPSYLGPFHNRRSLCTLISWCVHIL